MASELERASKEGGVEISTKTTKYFNNIEREKENREIKSGEIEKVEENVLKINIVN